MYKTTGLMLQEWEIDAAVAEQHAAEEKLVDRALALCARQIIPRRFVKEELARLITSGAISREIWSHEFRRGQDHLARTTHCAIELRALVEVPNVAKTLLYDARASIIANVLDALPEGYTAQAYSDGARVSVELFRAARLHDVCIIS